MKLFFFLHRGSIKAGGDMSAKHEAASPNLPSAKVTLYQNFTKTWRLQMR